MHVDIYMCEDRNIERFKLQYWFASNPKASGPESVDSPRPQLAK